MNEEKEVEITEVAAVVENELIPQMNVLVPNPEEKEDLIQDEKILGVYDEILNNIRNDREELSELIADFKNMVLNDGDATSSSKEAMVNLIKIKSDTSDRMSKVADLMTRIKLKEANTFPKYLAAHQNNTININSDKRKLTSEEKRRLIENENKKLNNKDVI